MIKFYKVRIRQLQLKEQSYMDVLSFS
jgi:hypothetical protein